MQTYTLEKNETELMNFIHHQKNEPLVLKTENGKNYLVMPFSPEKWQEMLVLFYQSVSQIQNMQNNSSERKSGKDFTDKWLGFMKDAKIEEDYKEEYFEHIKQKHK